MSKIFHGPVAALLTPRTASGGVDFEAFERLTEFVFEQGATGVAVAGGTGEYAALAVEDRKRMHERAVAAAAGRGAVIACPGAADFSTSVALAQQALSCGCQAVLLPPPHFYSYSQDDLESFFREAAREIPGPILLYNLPAFTTPIGTELALRLIESVPNIIGVKDSSGNLEMLEALTSRPELGACRILGHDQVFVEGLRRGFLDAVISGPAGVVPELSTALFESFARGDRERFEALAALFDELVERFGELPYPWMPLWIAEWRGLFPARFPLPLSAARLEQGRALEVWFRQWCERLGALDVAVEPAPAARQRPR
jgi:4-hydroxy-tetrahydrodipicolinate synthase